MTDILETQKNILKLYIDSVNELKSNDLILLKYFSLPRCSQYEHSLVEGTQTFTFVNQMPSGKDLIWF
jgi:hypothetical protein